MIGGDICAAPLYAAYHQGFFDGTEGGAGAHQQTEDTKDGWAPVSDGAPGIFFSWRSRSTTASTPGSPRGSTPAACRLVVRKDSPYRSWLTWHHHRHASLSSSAFAYFAIRLSRPASTSTGRAMRGAQSCGLAGTALTDGQVDAIAS